jgi:cell division protein FtsW
MSKLAQAIGLAPWMQRLQAWRSERENRLPIRNWDGQAIDQPTRIAGFDPALVWCVVGLLTLGLVMVYSASVALPDSPKYARYSPTFFLNRHALSLGIAFVAALLAVQVPVKVWEKWASRIFLLSLLLLAVVLIPYVGKGVNGARRWLPLGVMNFQPSELAKLGMAMYAASYMVRKMEVKERFIQAVWPMALALAFIGVLLLAEPDMGAFVVIALMALGVLFMGGVNGKMFFLSLAVLLAAFVLMIATSPFRRERILAFMSPWDPVYSAGKGYQLTHSLIAFGRGEVFGQGLGSSVEKLHYLPEAHTDFIMAVIGEELGLVGVLVVVAMFYWLVKRAFDIGRQAIALDQTFAGLAAKGIGIWIGVQTFINMGVNLGLLPTKGLTLPLMSFGGSGVMFNCIGLAILLRIDYENRVRMRGGRT